MSAILFFIMFVSELCQGKVIYTRHGPVKGKVLRVGEHEVYSFRNIPYAQPPTGNLRFERPKEHQGWSLETDLDGEIKIHCPQNSFFGDQVLDNIILGQENCLVLDVYVRKHRRIENVSLPVLVYLHGGGFNRGSKEDYGPDYLLRYNDIILVVPNYRLGILGFLSLQNSALSGNLGIWDQNAAIRWVFQNINRFGGDEQKITIAGHEAGAASVGLHILSHASHEYFQGAISGSGTALSQWLIDLDSSASKANKVVDVLRCATQSEAETLACLKTASLQEILKLQRKMKNIAFTPTLDPMSETPLMPFSPKFFYNKEYQKGVNYIIGFTENEAADEVSREFPNVLKYQHLDKMIGHFLKQHFENSGNFETIVKAAKYHYLRGIMIPTFESIEPRIAKMMTDFLYRSPITEVIDLHFKKRITENIFVYKYKSKNVYYCGLKNRRCYGNEYYIFKQPSQMLFSLKHEKEIQTLSKIWGNFIEFGIPDAREIWKPVKNADDIDYVEISDVIEPKNNFRDDDTEFWSSIVSELNAFENSTKKEMNLQPASDYSGVDSWGAAGLVVLCGVLCIALIGVVFITKKSTLTFSFTPVSSYKDTNHI